MSARVVQWATGTTGRLALRAVIEASDLELVGVRVYDADKVGRDAGDLAGCATTGVVATDRADDILALGADVVLVSSAGERRVPLAEYFTGYRQSVRERTELVKEVVVPLPVAPLTAFHKIAKRRYDDISSVAIAFALDVSGGVVHTARIGLGGVAATPIRARNTEATLLGQPWTDETVRRAAEVLAGEGTPIDDHRASASYRAAMLGQLLLKLHAQHPEGVPA